jgi:hypothetical protein
MMKVPPIGLGWAAFRDIVLAPGTEPDVVDHSFVAFYAGAYHLWQLMISEGFAGSPALQAATRDELMTFLDCMTRETLQ